MRALLLTLLTACMPYTWTAAAVIGMPGVYCQPVNVDVQICRDDGWKRNRRVWRCENTYGYWTCAEMPWWY